MARPWMPFYVADYLADTGHLSTLEHGAYMLLIMHYWQTGSLPTADPHLARICRMSKTEWAAIRTTMAELFDDDWHHKRIDAELAKVSEMVSKRTAAGKAGASARYANANANETANAEQSHGKRRAIAEQPDSIARGNSHPPTPTEGSSSSSSENPGSSNTGFSKNGSGKYAFEWGVVKLNQRDFDQWKRAFVHVNLEAELIAGEPWAAKQSNWFQAFASLLAKKEREARLALAGAKQSGRRREKDPLGNWVEVGDDG